MLILLSFLLFLVWTKNWAYIQLKKFRKVVGEVILMKNANIFRWTVYRAGTCIMTANRLIFILSFLRNITISNLKLADILASKHSNCAVHRSSSPIYMKRSYESLRSFFKTEHFLWFLAILNLGLCKKLTGAVFMRWQRKREQRIIVFMLNQKTLWLVGVISLVSISPASNNYTQKSSKSCE